ncbi:Retrovirus-related Pol polyprotein from transposon TNT 1-94 [Vitis vinifera]|uniref:Retrovirus-related Pol polyprotein from transposon TNT 1-94 n=1 Tax=Vitis vinifera TaxID=29760 RepID=A0A438J005_VITVI|nr:Retrovirus-related Pol polyprotein from transposon TNT 1-94 [Vitis vinifera]
MLYLMLTKCNGRKSMHNYAAYYGNLLILKFYIIFVPTKPALNFGLRLQDYSLIIFDAQIPHSLLFPTQPLYFLPPRVFGCTYFVHTLTPGQDKLSAKATKCIFLGYSRLQKGYRCYSPDTHRYFLSADITFFEDSPFFSSFESLPISKVLPLPHISPLLDALSRPFQVYHRRHRAVAPPLSSAEVPDDSPPVPPISPTPTLSSTDHLSIVLRKDNRSTRNPHPIYNFLSYHRLSSSYSAFISTLSSVSLPKITNEALSHPGWRQAMVDEMTALHSNGTWDLVSLPPGKSTAGCRWVYTVKVGPDSQVDSLKARLVAKGYTRIYGCDYGDTFSPVAKIGSVRLFLSMEVYMEQPPGFVAQGESGLVCKLRRSLYGLKQSPRAWFGLFNSVVQEFGMLRSEAVHSVFYHHNSSSQCIFLVVYVDDIVITGSDQEGIQRLKQHLFNHFQTKDLGKLKYFLGVEIAQSSSSVIMSQRKIRGASKRSWEISTTCRQTELPHHHSARHLFSWAIPKLLITQMQTGLVHPQIGVPPQGIVFLLEESRLGKDEQIKLVCDNQAALHIAFNPIFHERIKHIEVDCHFIREKIASRCVATSFVNSNDQLADIFTKSLRGRRIKYICNKLGAYDIYAPA